MDLEKAVKLHILEEKDTLTMHDYPANGASDTIEMGSRKFGPFANLEEAKNKRDEIIKERISETKVVEMGGRSFIVELSYKP